MCDILTIPGNPTFPAWKRDVEAILVNAGWSRRGVFRALKWGNAALAWTSGMSAADFAKYVDSEAPLGMAE